MDIHSERSGAWGNKPSRDVMPCLEGGRYACAEPTFHQAGSEVDVSTEKAKESRRERTSSRDGRVQKGPRLDNSDIAASKSGDSGDSLAALFGKRGLVSRPSRVPFIHSSIHSHRNSTVDQMEKTYRSSGDGVEHLGCVLCGCSIDAETEMEGRRLVR